MVFQCGHLMQLKVEVGLGKDPQDVDKKEMDIPHNGNLKMQRESTGRI